MVDPTDSKNLQKIKNNIPAPEQQGVLNMRKRTTRAGFFSTNYHNATGWEVSDCSCHTEAIKTYFGTNGFDIFRLSNCLVEQLLEGWWVPLQAKFKTCVTSFTATCCKMLRESAVPRRTFQPSPSWSARPRWRKRRRTELCLNVRPTVARSYIIRALSIATVIFCIFESLSTYPSPFFLECTSWPSTVTSNHPVDVGVPSPVIASLPGNISSSSALSRWYLGRYPQAPQ